MTNKEIDKAFEHIDEIAGLIYEGLVRNAPDGEFDAEKMRRYNALAMTTNALGIAYLKLFSIRKDHTLRIVDKPEEEL